VKLNAIATFNCGEEGKGGEPVSGKVFKLLSLKYLKIDDYC
jgi:hypothetical protein